MVAILVAFFRAEGLLRWGQLGDHPAVPASNKPVRVFNLSGVREISAGGWYGMVILNDGTVQTWGANNYGQLGDGTTATPFFNPR